MSHINKLEETQTHLGFLIFKIWIWHCLQNYTSPVDFMGVTLGHSI